MLKIYSLNKRNNSYFFNNKLNSDSFIIAYHISLVKVQTNYCNNNPLTLDVKHLNKIIKFYYFRTLNALWNGQGKIKMYYGMSRVKKQLSGKKFIPLKFISIDSTPVTKISKEIATMNINCRHICHKRSYGVI